MYFFADLDLKIYRALLLRVLLREINTTSLVGLLFKYMGKSRGSPREHPLAAPLDSDASLVSRPCDHREGGV